MDELVRSKEVELQQVEAVENVLWQLGTVKPELRPVLVELINYLRSKMLISVANEQATEQKTGDWAACIRTLRVQKGWTLQQLARESGVQISTISRTENGHRPSRNIITKLCAVLGHDVDSPMPEQGKLSQK